MTRIAPPTAIVEHIVADLKRNDCPALQAHLDDFQESLVERVMAGDLEQQGVAMARLREALALEQDLGVEALRGLLNRLSIGNQSAYDIISKHDSGGLNRAVCHNLMHFCPERPPGCKVSSFLLACYWLNSGDHDIFDRFATHLIEQRPRDLSLQYEILEAMTLPLQNGNQDNADALYTWLARNQDRIIAMGGSDLSGFGSRPLEVAVSLAQNHVLKLAKLIAEKSFQSPKFADLYHTRTLLDVIPTDARLAKEWAGVGTQMGWDEIGVLAALMTYHLAFDDSPSPSALGGQELNQAHALINSLKFLDERHVVPAPDRVNDLIDKIIGDTQDQACRREIMELFSESRFHRQLMSSSQYRDHSFGADLGI